VYVLDTDICIRLLNGSSEAAVQKLRQVPAEELGTTSITVAELRFGALNSGRPEANRTRVEAFVAPLTRLPFEDAAAVEFGRIKRELRARGTPIGIMDLLIASIVYSIDGTLVTNNQREFSQVPGLRVENWTRV
jgi:tRNA(fMet)-specific endonuclease VapC